MRDWFARWLAAAGTAGLAATLIAVTPALAAVSCTDALADLSKNWASIAVPGPGRESAPSEDERHRHTALQVEYMRSQLRLAARQCNEGNDHEALLRMDVVRAWLKLPEIRHPSDHHYRRQFE